MSEKLALFGGPKTIEEPFAPFNEIGDEEIEAATRVLKSGKLSEFLAGWDPKFYGGKEVLDFEAAWKQAFGVEHAVSVNSATSGIMVALGAIGLEPGDEVIVSPWTMSASATSILVWNAIPVFADIETATFNLDPIEVEKAISPRTRAIVVTDIFGHAARLDEIMEIAQRHDLRVIEDAAQAPGVNYHNQRVGAVADIGIYSLNCHKHIQVGEGGVCVTNNADLAQKMQLIRNHAESVVGDMGVTDLTNMIGFNLRLTEIQAAIATEQLKKLDRIVAERQAAAQRLNEGLGGLKGLEMPPVAEGCTNAYYVYRLVVDPAVTKVSRDAIGEALRAEGAPVGTKPVLAHLLPMYVKKQAYGRHGYPWSAPYCERDIEYGEGTCPVAEDLAKNRYFGIGLCNHHYTEEQTSLIVQAFQKVWRNLDKLG